MLGPPLRISLLSQILASLPFLLHCQHSDTFKEVWGFLFVFLILPGGRRYPVFLILSRRLVSITWFTKVICQFDEGLYLKISSIYSFSFSLGEILGTSVIIYVLCIMQPYYIYYSNYQKREKQDQKREEANARQNDIFAKFGRNKAKVTFSCLLGLSEDSYV